MLRLILRSPWPVHFVLGLALFALAWLFFTMHQDIEAEKALALQQGVPEAVSLDAFDPKLDIHPADEVHVIGWINFEHNYLLTETRKRKLSSTDVKRKMFVLFGPGDDASSKVAKAVLLLREGDVERFKAMAMENYIEVRGESFLFRLNGTQEERPELYEMANEALEKQGLTKAPGFVFIEMWGPKGREAALQPDQTTGLIMSGAAGGLGVLMVLIGFWRFRTPYKPVHRSPVATPEAEARAEAETAKTGVSGKSRKGLLLKIGLGLAAFAVIGALGHLDKVFAFLPLLIIVAIYLGIRQMGRAVSTGIGRALGRAPAPEAEKPAPAALPAWAMVAKTTAAQPGAAPVARDMGPVQSVPTVAARISGMASSAQFAKWIPFLVGLVIVILAPKLMGGLGVPLVAPMSSSAPAPEMSAPVAQVVAEPASPAMAPMAGKAIAPAPETKAEPVVTPLPPASQKPAAAPVANELPSGGGPSGIGAGVLQGIAFKMLMVALAGAVGLLGFRFHAGRKSSRRIAVEPVERWEKIARQARAGRAAAQGPSLGA